MRDSMGDQRGFSLIETMVALAIGLVILLAAGQFFIRQVEVTVSQERLAEVQQNARIAVDSMIRSARMAGYDPTGEAGAGVTTAYSGVFGFTMDLNADGDTTDDYESILCQLQDADEDGILELSAGDPQDVIADNIGSVQFVYTLADGSVTDTPSDPDLVRKVQIALTGQSAYDLRGPHHVWRVTGEAVLRNMTLRDTAPAQ